MKLRFILVTLSLLAFFSVSIGGYLYYTSLRNAAFVEADRNASARINAIHRNVLTFLSESVKPAKVLSGMAPLVRALEEPDAAHLDEANAILDYFTSAIDASVCYLMDRSGRTIASSNRNAPDSFVGLNFSFRPYFQKAMDGTPFTYLALGTTSDLRGAYYGHPIYGHQGITPIGVSVIKVAIDSIEQKIGLSEEDIVLITDPQGVIFITNQRPWLLQLAWKQPEQTIETIRRHRQFGDGPFRWIGLRRIGDHIVMDGADIQYLSYRKPLDGFDGWDIVYLRNRKAIVQTVVEPLIRMSGPIILIVSLLVAVSVFVLYQEASKELVRRKQVEKALEESTARYRNLYHQTPAMLHSIDSAGRMLSVSDYWLEAMEYRREDVIGKPLTGFLTPASRHYAEQIVIPQFFRSGFCKDIPYTFVTASGRNIEVLLSAIAERNDRGEIIRSLTVSIDVTERNRAVKALQEAQEELKSHSRKLEIEVARRTREISGILKYSSNIIYLKDRGNRYRLVNARFESIFGLSSKTIVGKVDADVLPEAIAARFSRMDQIVLDSAEPSQHEETFQVFENTMTFLIVTFPLFDDQATVTGLCSILTDVTEAKKMQDQYRRLSAGILESQERERAAIARELHDELGQVLTALRMDAVWLRNRLKNVDTDASLRAESMCASIEANIQEIRSIALRLRPRVLDDLGLVDALEWFTTDFERRTGIACIFQHDEPLQAIDNALSTAAYRIVQEALTNVARHARATFAEVNLGLHGGVLHLCVSDNGVGFDAGHLHDHIGLGIAGMMERASLVGGAIEITSSESEGSRIAFTAPLFVDETHQPHRKDIG